MSTVHSTPGQESLWRPWSQQPNLVRQCLPTFRHSRSNLGAWIGKYVLTRMRAQRNRPTVARTPATRLWSFLASRVPAALAALAAFSCSVGMQRYRRLIGYWARPLNQATLEERLCNTSERECSENVNIRIYMPTYPANLYLQVICNSR
jgi:hypothetical protein